jgi:hypothetical protein
VNCACCAAVATGKREPVCEAVSRSDALSRSKDGGGRPGTWLARDIGRVRSTASIGKDSMQESLS